MMSNLWYAARQTPGAIVDCARRLIVTSAEYYARHNQEQLQSSVMQDSKFYGRDDPSALLQIAGGLAFTVLLCTPHPRLLALPESLADCVNQGAVSVIALAGAYHIGTAICRQKANWYLKELEKNK